MKSFFIMIICSGLITASCTGQHIKQDKVPSVVVNVMKVKYPAATDVDWKKIGSNYEAEIDITSNNDVELLIDASGNILMMKEDVAATEIPTAITTYISQKYSSYKVDDVDRLEKDGVNFYQVELDARGKKDVKLVFAADGTLASSIKYWD